MIGSLKRWLMIALLGSALACSDGEASHHVELGSSRQAAVQCEEAGCVNGPHWIQAGSMAAARYRHTATLLTSGNVLIAGGANDSFGLPGFADFSVTDIELFDVMTGSFKKVGDLSEPRWGHTATLLRDGRVLFAGGFGWEAGLAAFGSAEIFSPREGTVDKVGALHSPRAMHSATLLADGRVLALGGLDRFSGGQDIGQAVTEAEIFDPVRATWDSLGDAPHAAFPHAAALMEDGTVTVAWPHGASIDVVSVDCTAATFSRDITSIPCDLDRFDIAASRIPLQPSTLGLFVPEQAFYLDPSGAVAREYFEVGPFVETRIGGSAAIAPVGENLFSFGGREYSSIAGRTDVVDLAAGYRLDPASGPINLMSKGRAWPTATTLPGGEVLVTGGLSVIPQSSAELQSTPWQTRPLQALTPATSDGHVAVLLEDGRVLFTGGHASGRLVSIWSPSIADAPLETVGGLSASREYHQAFLLRSGKVLVAGGDTERASDKEELFDPATGTGETLDFRLRARGNGVRLSETQFLFAGSTGLEKLDVSDWSVQSLARPLGCPAPGLVRLANGHVVVGGADVVQELDPSSMSLSMLNPPHQSSCQGALAGLPDGSILQAGGLEPSGELSTAAVRFNPSTGEVRVLPDLPRGLGRGKAAVRLGSVLLIDTASGSTSDIVYDWRFDRFDELPRQYRYLENDPSVTLLSDGGVLIASGDFARVVSEPLRQRPEVANKPLVEATPGEEVELTDPEFSTTWPELSGGTTAGSATNVPIAIWYPAASGWPLLGTFTKWSDGKATWRVPEAPFPGLGVLSYARGGVNYPLGMVRVQPVSNGEACQQNGACANGQCVEGMCCDRACDSPCEACSARLKGAGEDGICGPTQASCPAKPCINGSDCPTGFACSSNGECLDLSTTRREAVGCAPGCNVATSPGVNALGFLVGLVCLARRKRRSATSHSARAFSGPRPSVRLRRRAPS